jgi:hypothetical protein
VATAGAQSLSVTATGGGGWTCHRCRAWVPSGCTHHCPTTAIGPYPSPPPPVAHALDPVPAYHRIALALERIAAALEALNASQDATEDGRA